MNTKIVVIPGGQDVGCVSFKDYVRVDWNGRIMNTYTKGGICE